ncbi:MAG: FAD-dependent thymidylate synthase [Aeriscardovia sp.]|nr:FAD-dependent thymidylate synthase [Aeriscardovia sp.]
MEIIDYPYSHILFNPVMENRNSMVESARLCYKSVGKTVEADSKLLENCVKKGHWSPIEHSIVKARITCDRGISHELVRHRLAAFNQESTRYCNYSKGKFGSQISVIKPYHIHKDSMEYYIWRKQCEDSENAYFDLLDLGITPETARSVLPTCLATEIDITANLHEWYHILDLRTSRQAHPDMRLTMHNILISLASDYPEIFENLCIERNREIITDFVSSEKKGN